MSTQKRFSKLTFAAVILVAASATSFAQTESNKSRNESSSDAVAINNAPKVLERLANTNSASNTMSDSVAKESKFSAAKFMAAATRLSESDTSLTIAPAKGNEVRFDAQPALTDDFSKPATTKKITFVPSRGQKLPE